MLNQIFLIAVGTFNEEPGRRHDRLNIAEGLNLLDAPASCERFFDSLLHASLILRREGMSPTPGSQVRTTAGVMILSESIQKMMVTGVPSDNGA